MSDRFEICPFPKHEGKPWLEVVEDDRTYVEWLVEEFADLDDEMYDFLIELLEDNP